MLVELFNTALLVILNSVFLILSVFISRTVAQGVKLTFVNSLKIPLPKLETQKQIVAQLDQLQIETKKLETIYQQKINNLIELKKSILQKAFKGEL
jgi:type I restriction enzyme S subunit